MAATAASSAILFTDMFAVSAVDKGASSRSWDESTTSDET